MSSTPAGAHRGRLALCHGDLGGGLVWDRSARHLGVVDWGAAIVSDPVLDLASLASLSSQSAEVVAERVDDLRDRGEDATAVRSTFALQEMLYAARHQDWQQVVRLLHDY